VERPSLNVAAKGQQLKVIVSIDVSAFSTVCGPTYSFWHDRTTGLG